jgi:hypothetical protein
LSGVSSDACSCAWWRSPQPIRPILLWPLPDHSRKEAASRIVVPKRAFGKFSNRLQVNWT